VLKSYKECRKVTKTGKVRYSIDNKGKNKAVKKILFLELFEAHLVKTCTQTFTDY
jgi:hypothetical protein